MTGQPNTSDSDGPHAPRRLGDLLQAFPDGADVAERLMAELADVHVAHEELRVAEEELRTQQEQITQLLLQHEAERRWRGQVAALVPVGLCVTDGTGSLVDVNPAFAAHLGASLPRLRGKPLSVFLALDDAGALREALRALGSGEAAELRLTATLRPRHKPPSRAQLFGFTDVASHRNSTARIQWVLLPEDTAPGFADEVGPVDRLGRIGGEAEEEAIPAADVIGLASALTEFSLLPAGESDRQRLLSRMATLVRAAVPSSDWVSITVGSPLDPQRVGSDSAEAQDFDGRQLRAGEGPCSDTYRSGTVVVTDDVSTDLRWPTLMTLARGSDVRGVIAVPLREYGTTTGAVNVYSRTVGAFGAAGRRIAEFAAAAVAGVLQIVAERESMQTLAENLERALTSRAVIDQAKGMVMARLGVDADEAFARLVKLSAHLNVKVRDIAGLIVEGRIDAILRAQK